MAVYDKPPKRDISPSRGKHRRDLIAEYNKRYAGEPGDDAKPPSPKAGDEKP
jgi:hypothetical protein